MDDMTTKTAEKGWKKRVLRLTAIFFAAMLLLTLYTQVFLPSLLARVETTVAGPGRLTNSFFFQGSVEPVNRKYITAAEGIRVGEVLAKAGDELEKGAPLLRLELSSLREAADTARLEVSRARLRAEQARLAMEKSDPEYSGQKAEYSLESAELAVQRAKTVRDEAAAALQEVVMEYSWMFPAAGGGAFDPDGVEFPENNGYYGSIAEVAKQAFTAAKQKYQEAAWALTDAQRALEQAKEEAAALTGNQAREQQDAALQLELLELELTEASAASERLSALLEQEGVVTMPEDGSLIELTASAGQTTTVGPVAWYACTADGFQVRVKTDAESISQIQTGASVSVALQRKGKEVSMNAKIGSVDFFAKEPYFLVPLPEQDYQSGSGAAVSLKTESAVNYEALVPVEALRRDENGYFVLELLQSESIWGREYTTKRQAVQVLAQDAQNAAVTLTEPGKPIISFSNRPIRPGDRVRRMS